MTKIPDDELIGYCDQHPWVETGLRCKHEQCRRFLCAKCARQRRVGSECAACARVLERRFLNGRFFDYAIAPLITVPQSLLIGFLFLLLSGYGLAIFIAWFVGPVICKAIARSVWWGVGRRRSRHLANVTAASFSLPLLLLILMSLAMGYWYGAIALLVLAMSGTGALKARLQ